MRRFGQEPPIAEGVPPEPGDDEIRLNALDSMVLKTYFNESRKRGLNDAWSLEFLIENHTAPENQNMEYVNKVIELGKQLGYNPKINVSLDNWLRAKEMKEEEGKETKEKQEKLEKEKKEKGEFERIHGVPLEEQLAKAITEERYEDAQKIKEQLDKIKRLTEGKYSGTLCLGDVK